jgi:ATP-dependent DNA helicase PIF1
MQNQICFGGKKIVLGGDFRQTPPIEPKAPQSYIVQLSIKNSVLWGNFKTFQLTQNLRVQTLIEGNDSMEEFEKEKFVNHSNFLLDIGNGKLADQINGFNEFSTAIPDHYLHSNQNLMDFIYSIYPELEDSINPNIESSADVGILTPLNSDVDIINDKIIDKLHGDLQTYYSVDELLDTDDSDDFSTQMPVEFINILEPSGFPKHELKLKIGSCVMLLRNLDVEKGLCNGTKLTILKMCQHLLQCEILTGSNLGKICNIPRINLHHKVTKSIGFSFSRRQFPVRLAYCMTINKSQGQTLTKVGIFLPNPCFGHGLLYVAISRCGNPSNVRIFIKQQKKIQGKKQVNNGEELKTFTDNIVFYELLL